MALGAATVSAQMEELNSLFREFGNCMGEQYGSYAACKVLDRPNSQCCNFEVVGEETITGKFCVSDQQRLGEYSGVYRDYDYTLWNWKCKEPENVGPVEVKTAEYVKELVLPPWSTLNDGAFPEWWLWISFLSAEAWLFGYPIGLPMAYLMMFYLQIWASWTFFEMLFGTGTFWDWLIGPQWLAYWVYPIILSMGFGLSTIPILNFLTAFLFGWWAVAAYYDYNYVLFEGVVIPDEYYVERLKEDGE